MDIYRYAGPDAGPDESVPDSIEGYATPDAEGEDAAKQVETGPEEDRR